MAKTAAMSLIELMVLKQDVYTVLEYIGKKGSFQFQGKSFKDDKKVSFLHYDQLIDVIPSSLKEPFFVASVGGIEKVSILFQNAFHDPSLANNAINILSSYLIYIYPDEVSYTADQLVVIFGYLAKDFLRIRDNDLDKMCEEYELNKEDTLQEIIKIKKHIENS